MEMVLFSLKMIGSSLILFSGVLIGWGYGCDIEKRYTELCDLRRDFQIIYGDISYGANSLNEVIGHAREQCIGKYQEFFQYIEEEIKNKTKRRICEIWIEGIDLFLEKTYLEEADIQDLKRVGQNLGNVDREQQLVMLQMYLNKLQQSIEKLELEKEKRIKLCRTLGVLGSVFVVVILL